MTIKGEDYKTNFQGMLSLLIKEHLNENGEFKYVETHKYEDTTMDYFFVVKNTL